MDWVPDMDCERDCVRCRSLSTLLYDELREEFMLELKLLVMLLGFSVTGWLTEVSIAFFQT